MQPDGSRGRRWRAVTAWARRVRPVVVARVASALAFAKREFREQFPSDEEWARAVDEAREVAAFEEATNAARLGEIAVRARDDGVVDAGVASIVLMTCVWFLPALLYLLRTPHAFAKERVHAVPPPPRLLHTYQRAQGVPWVHRTP